MSENTMTREGFLRVKQGDIFRAVRGAREALALALWLAISLEELLLGNHWRDDSRQVTVTLNVTSTTLEP